MRIPSILCGAAAGALVLGFAVGGVAAAATPPTSGSSSPHFAVTAGYLQISNPASDADLGTTANSLSGETVTGTLGTVQVTDERSGNSGWTATVTTGGFYTTDPATIVIAPSKIGYNSGPITLTGGANAVLYPQPTSLAGAAVNVVGVTDATGTDTGSWNPTIKVEVAAGSSVSTYTAKFTHSVS